MKTLRLYSRPGCSLCETLEDELHDTFAGRFHLSWQHVDRDADKRAQWGDQIPVLLGENDEVLSVGQLDFATVDAYLK